MPGDARDRNRGAAAGRGHGRAQRSVVGLADRRVVTCAPVVEHLSDDELRAGWRDAPRVVIAAPATFGMRAISWSSCWMERTVEEASPVGGSVSDAVRTPSMSKPGATRWR